MSEDHLRVALLLDDDSIQEWHRAALRELVDRTAASIDLLVINQGSDEQAGDSKSNVTPWKVYNAVRSRLGTDGQLRSYRRRHHIDTVDILSGAERTYCRPIPADGLGNELPDEVVETLSEYDLAIRFGFGIVVGDVLRAPEHGVLSFHHGDFTSYRGRPAGFWEFLEGSPEAGITLQRLNETLDGGEIVTFRAVDITSLASWPEVMTKLLEGSIPMLADGIEVLTDPDREPWTPDELGELYLAPEWRDIARYVLRRVQRTVRLRLRL